MFKEKAKMADSVVAGLDTNVTPPEHPCEQCGATTKRHHDKLDDDDVIVGRTRICSKRDCRHVVDEA